MWFYADSLGPEAALLRSSGGVQGKVLAVVRDGVYLQSFQGYVICLVPEIASDGPLSVRTGDFKALRALVEGWAGRDVWFGAETVVIGDEISVAWKQGKLWRGVMPAKVGTGGRRKKATVVLDALLQVGPEFALAAIPAKLTDGLEGVVQGIKGKNAEQAGRELCGMLGDGEGLTPLGDDIAMGMLAAMVWLAEAGMLDRSWVDRIAGRVRGLAGGVTNRISERLLWHAGEGILYEPAMDLGAALIAGRAGVIDDTVHKLLAIGQSTGHGVAAGIRWVAGM